MSFSDPTNCRTCGAELVLVNQAVRSAGSERLVIFQCSEVKSHQWEVTSFMRPFGHPVILPSGSQADREVARQREADAANKRRRAKAGL